MNQKGIAVAGNLTMDLLYPIHGLPGAGELTSITAEAARSTGGCVCNGIIDLAMLDPQLPLTALGRVGEDDAADYVLGRMSPYANVDLSQIRRDGTTSFTLVLDDILTHQRSFCHWRGANARFCESDIDWEKLDVSLLHIGYVLLLDALDAPDEVYGTKLARLLHTARERGIKTSVDIVTESGDRYSRIAVPALRYADYCVINEAEAQATTGVRLVDSEGRLLRDRVPEALRVMKAMGVGEWAVIHSPEGGFGLDARDRYVELDALTLPEGYIRGTVGAGDAFCSGVLYGAWKGLSLGEALEMGTAAAACSLSQPGSTEGMRSCAEALALYRSLR